MPGVGVPLAFGRQRGKPGDMGKKLVMHISTVYWKSDERLLFRVTIRPEEDAVLSPAASSKIAKLGDRLFAINRDGTNMVAMLGDNRNAALDGAFVGEALLALEEELLAFPAALPAFRVEISGHVILYLSVICRGAGGDCPLVSRVF